MLLSISHLSKSYASGLQALKKPPVTVEGRFQAAPGMFSHDRVDPGSELLAERLPTDFDGNAADFGAGWGYLTVRLADQAPRVNRVDLFEADYKALEFAKGNVARNCPNLNARFFWQDLASEPVERRYDAVVMNPPFHAGRAAEISLGRSMIEAAAKALKPGGLLWLVGNRGLPYEPELARLCRQSGELLRDDRYKILWARR